MCEDPSVADIINERSKELVSRMPDASVRLRWCAEHLFTAMQTLKESVDDNDDQLLQCLIEVGAYWDLLLIILCGDEGAELLNAFPSHEEVSDLRAEVYAYASHNYLMHAIENLNPIYRTPVLAGIVAYNLSLVESFAHHLQESDEGND